jgi:hypothetical protein
LLRPNSSKTTTITMSQCQMLKERMNLTLQRTGSPAPSFGAEPRLRERQKKGLMPI